jgi:hypothetical protein
MPDSGRGRLTPSKRKFLRAAAILQLALMSKRKRPTYPDAEARLRKALERLGDDNPKCKYCPEDDPRCLERHEVAGQAFSKAYVIVCRNCHRKLSDAQYDHPPRIDDNPPAALERVGHLLLGLADLLRLAASKLDEIGKALIDYAAKTLVYPSPAEGGASC